MTLPKGTVHAVYSSTDLDQYHGNPLIEALPPILKLQQVLEGLAERIDHRPEDVYLDPQRRIHRISQLLDGFFQPLSRHVALETKLSIMLRQGYVGRNMATGDLNTHIQNGYERVQQGDLDVFRFDHVKSTAQSLAFIGCSGSGKTSSLNRILATYPQLIYHEQYNFTQIVFLKIDCPYDGSLKSLCHNFFREMDAVLGTDYVRRYVQKRHSIETLIAQMALVASMHAVGLLVIDEIQHLNLKNSGGAEIMLNFFVTLVNEMSLPVVMVGTPKARFLFDADFRSARRAAGFGSILWEPLSKPSEGQEISKTEWGAFTRRLWKYQWLTKASSEISEEIQETWYDLSQGIMDVVIKLFVLSQIRAVEKKVERITAPLMKQVYQDELKPIHPMIDALRSGDTSKIARYSDLTIPDIDKKILDLSSLLNSEQDSLDSRPKYRGNDQAIRFHNMLVEMGYESDLLEPLITRVFDENPDLSMKELMPKIIEWYQADAKKPEKKKPQTSTVKKKDWHTLDSDDLRFLSSQASNEDEMYETLEKEGLLFDADHWVETFG